MNSTVNGWEPPLQPIFPAAVGLVWASLAFILFSLGILVYKLVNDRSYLRLACFIVGLVTFGKAILNGLHIIMSIPFILDIIMRLVVVSFVNLVVAVSFIISSRFYRKGHHTNVIYYIALAAVVVANILAVVSLLKRLLAPAGDAMFALSIVTRVSLLVTVVLSYGYAFKPVVCSKSRDSASPVAIAVGVWYMTGMSIILIFQLAIGIPSIVMMNNAKPEYTVISNAVETSLIMLNLDFYSLPPSRAIIFIVRRWIFPTSVIEPAGLPKSAGMSQERILP